MAQQAHTLTFLGTGAACGVPSFYCGCKACEEARSDPRARRTCSSLMITGAERTLIDTAPELRLQLIREGVSSVDRILYTHEHFDHTGGLPQLEFYVRLKTQAPLPLYAPEQTLAAIEQQYPYLSDVISPHRLETFQTLDFDGVRYTALPATHSEGCLGYLIETAATRIAYFPDTGPLPEESLAYMEQLDILIIDATFNGANWMPASHHCVDEAIALALRLKPRQTYLSHLSMHYDTPITTQELTKRLREYGGDRASATRDGDNQGSDNQGRDNHGSENHGYDSQVSDNQDSKGKADIFIAFDNLSISI